MSFPRFLLKYRVTPHAMTGIAPAELLMGCRIQTLLDLLYPTTKQKVQSQQQAQVKYKGKQSHAGVFNQGNRVMARNFAYGECWIAGVVMNRESNVMYKVKVDDGRVW